jgi:hypothetical protein
VRNLSLDVARWRLIGNPQALITCRIAEKDVVYKVNSVLQDERNQ